MTEINPDAGSRNWTQLFAIENGKPVPTDNSPLFNWTTDNGERPTDEWFASQGYYGLATTEPPFVNKEEGYVTLAALESWEVNEENKTVIQKWDTIYFTEEEKAEQLKNAWQLFRDARDEKLLQSDWTQVADSPLLGNGEWLSYRQALRDLPSTTVDPRKPEWPAAPQ